MTRVTLVLVLALATLVAGCTSEPSTPATATPTASPSPAEPTPTATPTATPSVPTETTPTPATPTPPTLPNFTIELAGVPASVAMGADISFTMYVNGTETFESDHIGAHYGMNSTNGTNETPSTTFYPVACIHKMDSVPGTFNVTCPNAKAGHIALRGHMRLNDTEAGLLNFWSDEARVLVLGNMTLSTSISPAAIARVGVPFHFNLTATGDGNFTSTHIGAHYNSTSQASSEPTVARYAKGCDHASGPLPGVVQVTCTFEQVGTVFLRGHARLMDSADMQHDFWGPEQTLTVAP